MVFVTGLVIGIVLYVIGSLMEHAEDAKRERARRNRWQ